MSAVNNGGTAFPLQDPQAINAYASARVAQLPEGSSTDERDRVYLVARAEAIGGLTVRDYFAAKAMHGLMAMDGAKVGKEGMQIPKHADIVAEIAYQMADAMLLARSQS